MYFSFQITWAEKNTFKMSSYPSVSRQKVKSWIQKYSPVILVGFPLIVILRAWEKKYVKLRLSNSQNDRTRHLHSICALSNLLIGHGVLFEISFQEIYSSSEVHMILMGPNSLFIQNSWDWGPQKINQKKLPGLWKSKFQPWTPGNFVLYTWTKYSHTFC